MTFKQYLAKRKLEYDARSDFTRLAKVDPHFPDAETLEEVHTYVEKHFSNEMIWYAATDVWNEYKTALKSDRLRMA